MIKLIVFDLDGTVVDSKELYVDTIQKILAAHSVDIPRYKISRGMGLKLKQTLLNFNYFEPVLLEHLKKEINYEVERKALSLRVCPYAIEVLKILRNGASRRYKMILMTNSTHRYAKVTLNKNGITKYFDKVLGADDFLNKEAALRTLFRKHHIKPVETIYVGDRRSDFKIAKDVGCKIILVKSKSWDKTEISAKKNYRNVSVRDLRGVLPKVEI